MQSVKYSISLLYLISTLTLAADIHQNSVVNCISYDSVLQGTHRNSKAQKESGVAKQRFSEWLLSENFSEQNSKLKFIWTPGIGVPPEVKIITTDKNHHRVRIQAMRKGNLIIVSEASDPFFNLESWTFALNFKIESLIATRVQSNVAALKAEVIRYNCQFMKI
ncbi:MAG: hypothetical protein ACI8XC_004472 [Gammaproteobacteria bacterium]|jgi:hypothetical protein